MAWLRLDDHEVLDSRVGQLDDGLYRARHALMQLVARDNRDTGLFRIDSIVHAAYSTPKGPKALTKKGLERLIELGFLRGEEDYTVAELDDLGIEWPRVGQWMRIENWEKYNPPRDTNAERQARFRKRRNEESNGDRNVTDNEEVTDASSRRRAGARPRSRPVPSPPSPLTSPNHSPAHATDEGGHDPYGSTNHPRELALLHTACGSDPDALTKLKRGSKGATVADLVAAREAATGPGVRDPLAVALTELKGRRDAATTRRETTEASRT